MFDYNAFSAVDSSKVSLGAPFLLDIKDKISISTAVVGAVVGILGLLFGTNLFPQVKDALHAWRATTEQNASDGFAVGDATADDKSEAYKSAFTQSLLAHLGSAGLNDPAASKKIKAVLSDVGAEDVLPQSGNAWKGHAKVVAIISSTSNQNWKTLTPSCNATGVDANDASWNAATAVAAKLAAQVQNLVKPGKDDVADCFN